MFGAVTSSPLQFGLPEVFQAVELGTPVFTWDAGKKGGQCSTCPEYLEWVLGESLVLAVDFTKRLPTGATIMGGSVYPYGQLIVGGGGEVLIVNNRVHFRVENLQANEKHMVRVLGMDTQANKHGYVARFVVVP